MFPLGKTGGLIEARARSATTAMTTGRFPLGKTGGLIEAERGRSRSTSARHVFPLGKTGGLIEASITPISCCVTWDRVSAG